MKLSLPMAAMTALACAGPAAAADPPEFALVIKNHQYHPTELHVPADTKFKIRVTNEDATPEEFESTDFNRESVVLPNHSIVVFIGPLHAGTYGFFGDFHRDTAQGRLVVE
jgi:hypothetical protein